MKRKQLLAFVLVIVMMIGMMPGAKALSFGGECPSPYNHGSHFSPTNVPICFWCGYNGCTHTNNKWDDKKDSSVLPVYQIENEQNHRVISSYKRYCKDCGAYMKNVTDDGKLEAHNFTNGDTCVCGYKKPVCTHAGRNWEDVYNSSKDSFSDITSECHTIYYYRDRYCKDCGAYVTTVNKITATQKHDFTNGDTCICGYKKPVCTHSNGNWNDVYDSSVQPVYQIENDQYHRIFNSYKRYCKDCNQYVKNVSDNGARRSHIFPNGDTCICGYKKPTTGGESQHVGVSARIDTEYRQYSNATAHQKRDVYGYTCSVCSETVIERYTEWTPENHKDSGEGWCLLCGAAVEAAKDWESLTEGDPSVVASLADLLPSPSDLCDHSLTIRTDYEKLNATFHFDKKYTVCSICGMEDLIRVTTATHTPNSVGKCTACELSNTVSYKGKEYTITVPTYNTNTNDHLDEGWTTVGTEVIDVKKDWDWAGWIGDFEAMEVTDPGSMSVPDYKSQNGMQSVNTSSGLSSLGKVGKIGTGVMFVMSAVNDALEHYTVQTIRIAYQEKNNEERRAILEVGSNKNGNRAGNSYSYVQWILANAKAGNPLTYTYGLANMVLSPHSIVNEEVRKVFTDYDLKDDYYYDFQFEYSKEWSADPYYAYIAQNEYGEWGYTLRIKEGDEFRLRGVYQGKEHVIDLTEDMTMFMPMSSEGAKEIESILQQAK